MTDPNSAMTKRLVELAKRSLETNSFHAKDHGQQRADRDHQPRA